MTKILPRVLALTVAPLTLTAVACSSSGGSGGQAAPGPTTEAPAPTTPAATTPATNPACALVPNAAAKPPAFWPAPTDATWYQTVRQGATTQWFAYAPGHDVRARRDAIKTLFTNAGYELKDQDAEANEEAEAEFEGKGHGEVTVQVIPREGCETQVRIRYRGDAGE